MSTPINYISPVTYIVGQAISPNIPTESMNSMSWAIGPSLPPGLLFDSTTGTISGIPLSTSPTTVYNVIYDTGDGAGSITITVIDPPSSSGSSTSISTVQIDLNRAFRRNSHYNKRQRCIQRKTRLNISEICSCFK